MLTLAVVSSVVGETRNLHGCGRFVRSLAAACWASHKRQHLRVNADSGMSGKSPATTARTGEARPLPPCLPAAIVSLSRAYAFPTVDREHLLEARYIVAQPCSSPSGGSSLRSGGGGEPMRATTWCRRGRPSEHLSKGVCSSFLKSINPASQNRFQRLRWSWERSGELLHFLA